MNTIFSKLALTFAAAALIGACSSPVKLNDRAPVSDSSSSNSTDTRAVHTAQAGSDPLNDPKGLLADRSVYFDFDKYDVKDEYDSMLSTHANYLNSHPARKVLIQGNTDERGGQEYNLALGQKRAVGVTKRMSVLGVSESQMEAVSLGKEKPKALGHDEDAWAENRRADIVY
jgi:peptidoglycan-associated lipoprotein